MPILDPAHDLAHPVETESAWSESYYFNCYDPDGHLPVWEEPLLVRADVRAAFRSRCS